MVTWKKWKAKLEDIFVAVAYAEANDHNTARQMAPFTTPLKMRSWVNSLSDAFAAVAFAEADMPEMARALLERTPARRRPQTLESFTKAIGLKGVRFAYGIAYV